MSAFAMWNSPKHDNNINNLNMELTHAQAFNIIVNVSGQASLSRKDHETVTLALTKIKELIKEDDAATEEAEIVDGQTG